MRARAEQAPAAASDPWGIRAWARRQPDGVEDIDPDTQEPATAINGNIVEALAQMIATAAGLAPDSRVNWDALGGWCRENVDIEPRTLEAIRTQARHMREAGDGIRSIAVFDKAVRNVADRRAA